MIFDNSTLKTLEYLCEWIPLEKIYKPASQTVDMRQIFSTLMQEGVPVSTRILATRCLKGCVSRHKVFAQPIVNHVRPMISIVNESCLRLNLPSTLPSVVSGDLLYGGNGSGNGNNSNNGK